MKNRIATAFFVVAAMLFLAGCGRRINYELPVNPIEFHTGTFVNPSDPDDTFQSVEYNGRTYIMYGTVKKTISGDDVGACLGYIVQDGVSMKDARFFLLNADPGANYLVRCDIGGIMEQPVFYRALDTRGKTINTPPFIENLEYPYWK